MTQGRPAWLLFPTLVRALSLCIVTLAPSRRQMLGHWCYLPSWGHSCGRSQGSPLLLGPGAIAFCPSGGGPETGGAPISLSINPMKGTGRAEVLESDLGWLLLPWLTEVPGKIQASGGS